MSEVRVRFAPSPTGMFHVGSARTALFNWLYARHMGGKFILRIEDTDANRNTPEALAVIFQGLDWLGMDWDEGPCADGTEKGDRGPYFQSKRNDIYQQHIEKLLSDGKAYEDDGAVKFKIQREPVTVPDLICGDVTFDNAQAKDLVIRRANGSAVFHLVNVVDDLEMGLTHVIRGEDHLSNTPKHLALFEALGAEPPKYAHIPLILNPGGSKMSKRDEGAVINDYRGQGYLPDAVMNYLCLLGWSPKDNSEIFPISEVIKKFDLPLVNRSNARFDINKLYWINGEYWRALDKKDALEFTVDYLKSKDALPAGYDDDYLSAALDIIREKIKLGRDLPEWMEPFLNEELTYEAKGLKKFLLKEGALERLKQLKEGLEEITDFKEAEIQSLVETLTEKHGVKIGEFLNPMRMASSGRSVGPSFFRMLEVFGKERVLNRFESTIAKLESGELSADTVASK